MLQTSPSESLPKYADSQQRVCFQSAAFARLRAHVSDHKALEQVTHTLLVPSGFSSIASQTGSLRVRRRVHHRRSQQCLSTLSLSNVTSERCLREANSLHLLLQWPKKGYEALVPSNEEKTKKKNSRSETVLQCFLGPRWTSANFILLCGLTKTPQKVPDCL